MRRSTICTAIAVSAAMLMGLGVVSASANRLSADDLDIRMMFMPISASIVGMGTIECNMILLGNYHTRTFVKDFGTLIGHITSVTTELDDCQGGTLTFLSDTLPWHRRYAGHIGALPNVDGIGESWAGLSVAVSTELATCLARSSTAEPVRAIHNVGGGGAVSSTTMEEGAIIDASDTTGSFCDLFGMNMAFSGTGSTDDGSGGSIVFTLI